jgi:hypothetical protein
MEEDNVEYASEEQVHQWSEEGDAEYVQHDELYQATHEDVVKTTQEEDWGPSEKGWGPPNNGENSSVDYNAADGGNSFFSADDRNWDNCETCNNSEEVQRVYCQNCDRPQSNPDQVCSHCVHNRGWRPYDNCQGPTDHDRAKIDISSATVRYKPRQPGRYPERDALLSLEEFTDNTFEAVLRRVNDADALRGDKDPLFDERRPLVLTVDDYYLFPGRTSGEGSWTITIGRDRAAPSGRLQNIRRSMVDKVWKSLIIISISANTA